MSTSRTAFSLVLLAIALAIGCSSGKSAEKGDEGMETMEETEMAEEMEPTDESMSEGEETAETAPMEATPVKGGPDGVEVGGYCPVAYKLAGKSVEGSKEFAVEHGGKTYYLAGAKAVEVFAASPEKFEVKYEGWCATGIAKGKKIQSDPKLFTVHEDEIYLFSSEDAKAAFDANPDEMAARADGNWSSM